MKRHLRAPSPALVIALIALFVALGGTSIAAINALPKNSVGAKQLKKNAVTGVKIKNKAVTAAKINTKGLNVPNATHATSADSATSATNATNATNATSATNATHATNADQLGGVAASGYTRATLPSGSTETGAWFFGTNDGTGGGGSNARPAFSLQIPLAAGLDGSHTIYVSGASATHCSGVGHADPGFLCVYQLSKSNANTPSNGNIFNPEGTNGPPGTGAHGWSIFLSAAAAGSWYVGGSYSVTAP